MTLEPDLRRVFAETWTAEHGTPAPELADDTVLLDSGLDSMGFAIFVSNLEEAVGFDPFSLAEDAYYPRTFGEFVAFYDRFNPAFAHRLAGE